MKHNQGIRELAFLIFFIAVLGFTGLIFAKFNLAVNDKVQADGYGLTVEQQQEVDGLANSIPASYDQGLILALVVSYIILCVSVLLLNTNALFFIFGLGQYVFTVIMIPVAANLFIKAYNVSSINEIASSMPITALLMQNYVLINVLMASVVLVLAYMRSKI